jgi:antitoxin HigA-1
MHNPPHPGTILANYIEGHTVADVAAHLGVTRPALSRVLNGRAAISAEMAVRIGKVFNTDPGLWVRMQGQYDLWHASKRSIKAHPLSQVIKARQAVKKSTPRKSPLHFVDRRPAALAARSTHTLTARSGSTVR